MTDRPPTPRPGTNLPILLLVAACWLAVVAVPPVLFLRWRGARLAEVSSPAAQADWDRFRDDMREQSGDHGPVRRKVPRSAEPPERIWLRDYPHVVVAAWVIFVGLLGGIIAAMLRGAAGGVAPRPTRVSGRGSADP
ncbi:MAG: hypothetical protein ACKOSQ_06355 [Planctomycetaceae bacterium]